VKSRQTRRCLAALLGMLLLAACSRVENLAGVTLATPNLAPTATPPPTATPAPQALTRPRTITKEFTGTTVTVSYPDGWEQVEGGQSLTLSDPAYPDRNGPGVNLRIALTRTVAVDAGPDGSAPLVMQRFLEQARGYGFFPQEALPGEDAATAFSWGGHDAAVFLWQSDDGATRGAHVLVLTGDKRRFVIMTAATGSDLWPDFEPTWLAILSSLALDGVPLPPAELLAAYERARSE